MIRLGLYTIVQKTVSNLQVIIQQLSHMPWSTITLVPADNWISCYSLNIFFILASTLCFISKYFYLHVRAIVLRLISINTFDIIKSNLILDTTTELYLFKFPWISRCFTDCMYCPPVLWTNSTCPVYPEMTKSFLCFFWSYVIHIRTTYMYIYIWPYVGLYMWTFTEHMDRSRYRS